MVDKNVNVTSLTQNGLRDWLLQRITSVVLALYTFMILGFLIFSHPVTFDSWHQYFTNPFIKIFTILTVLSVVIHAWIGIWTVLTDYVKPFVVRIFLEAAILVVLAGYLAWGLLIVWGV